MKRLLDDMDTDKSGDLSFEQFVPFVQRVRERLAVAAKRRERIYASRLGFSDTRVAQIRVVFYDQDTADSGFLRPDQVRGALEALQVPKGVEEIRSLMDGVLSRNGNDQTVSFEGFLILYKSASLGEGSKELIKRLGLHTIDTPQVMRTSPTNAHGRSFMHVPLDSVPENEVDGSFIIAKRGRTTRLHAPQPMLGDLF